MRTRDDPKGSLPEIRQAGERGRAELMQKLANNPRFKRAEETGVGYIIVGYKLPEVVKAHQPGPGRPAKPVKPPSVTTGGL